MKLLKAAVGASALGIVLLGGAIQSASAGCQLNSPGGHIKRVVYLIFDNVHLRRDNPNVPSDPIVWSGRALQEVRRSGGKRSCINVSGL